MRWDITFRIFHSIGNFKFRILLSCEREIIKFVKTLSLNNNVFFEFKFDITLLGYKKCHHLNYSIRYQ